MTSPGLPPVILVVSDPEDADNQIPFADLLREVSGERHRWIRWTVMDACLRMLPEDYAVAVLDIGMLEPLHRELLEKFLGENPRPVIVHLSDGRPETVRFLESLEPVRRIRKPASLHEVLGVIDGFLGGPASPDAPSETK